jgi:hypothetical protein
LDFLSTSTDLVRTPYTVAARIGEALEEVGRDGYLFCTGGRSDAR